MRCNDIHEQQSIGKTHYFMLRGNNYKFHDQCLKELLTEVLFNGKS